MRTLITLLGASPGTVTATYYALCEQGYGLPERVVVVATGARETKECLKMIREEFSHLEPAGPRLEEVIVPISDLADEATTKEFQAHVAAVLRRERDRPGNQVWLSIAGGRKSMAALAATAAQLIGVDKMFHLYVARELEQHGDVNQLLLDPGWQPRCLHPAKEKYTLVEVPFFELSVERGQLRLLLEGQPDAFVHEIVRANPAILTQLPDDVKRAYWAYVIEKYGQPPQYEELAVRIGPRPSPGADFSVTAYGEADVTGEFVPLFTTAKVQAVIGAMSEQCPVASQRRAAHDLGRHLFDGLFTGDLLRAYYRKQGWVASKGHRLRLRLRLAADARLDGLPLRRLPWELLHDEREFLGLRRDLSIVRHPETDEPAGPLPVKWPLRMLIAAASPKDQGDLSKAEKFELDGLRNGVQPLALRLAVDGLDDPPRTFEALKHRLADIHPCHVLYFTGHGGPGGLVFEKDDGTSDVRPAGEVAALLMGQGVRLVVLNACYGAQAPAPDLSSVAEALVEAGLPAVVGMQSAILTGEAEYAPAVRFAKEFFFRLALGWPVDACVTEARMGVRDALSQSLQWALPVCFMRAGDGRLFSFESD
jgi:CRISPR-associated Csx14 family protein